MLTTKKLTIRVFGCEFEVPEEYLNGYVFCARTGRVYVSNGDPIREKGGWSIKGFKYITVGRITRFLTEEESTKSAQPLMAYLVGIDVKPYQHAIEEGRLYTWGTGQSVYLRANKRVYLVEPNTGSFVDLGPSYEFQRLIAYYSGFRYVSSWGAGNDKSSE